MIIPPVTSLVRLIQIVHDSSRVRTTLATSLVRKIEPFPATTWNLVNVELAHANVLLSTKCRVSAFYFPDHHFSMIWTNLNRTAIVPNPSSWIDRIVVKNSS